MKSKEEILKLLHAQININGHILGAVAGSGMNAKFVTMGGVDFLLALSAGRFRMTGRSSFASYLCYDNSNELVMIFGTRELLPIMKDVPILFGLAASDPTIHLYEFLKRIKNAGFSGVTNFPTVALIDGKFREALEEDGNSYDNEVEAIKLANYLGLFTVAFVTNEEETRKMLDAGADIICVHLGLTKGGFLGAGKYVSLDEARRIADRLFAICDEVRPDVIKMVYAGPANTPIDMQYLYHNTQCQGYIGGSTFDRIPTERAILNTARAFKTYGGFAPDDPLVKLTSGSLGTRDYVPFVIKYIEDNYMKKIELRDLALVAHVSSSYLSTKFKKEIGCSFTEYLLKFRMNKAKEFIEKGGMNCREAAEQVGYTDYVQFSKNFKKHHGVTPNYYLKSNINTTNSNKDTKK